MKALQIKSFFVAASLFAMVLTGCSSEAAKAAAPQAAPKAAKTVAAPEPTEEVSPKSVFTSDHTGRDPFFPKARVQVEVNTQTDVSLDVRSILQANFHGVVSSGGKSIAFVNNIMLEEGRNAVIPIRAGGHERQIAVRCREVTKDSVVLELQGDPEPLRLTRVGR
jgi:Na+-transporting NADH:ubiquinone oxidoreductase subunit NqrF